MSMCGADVRARNLTKFGFFGDDANVNNHAKLRDDRWSDLSLTRSKLAYVHGGNRGRPSHSIRSGSCP